MRLTPGSLPCSPVAEHRSVMEIAANEEFK
jgi:hypothetical protein